MKIVFNLPEDDPRNPGVIADCTGDNAGDSVGPTADGFETYGVTGVALIAFLALALAANPALCGGVDRVALRHAHPDDHYLPRELLGERCDQPLRLGTGQGFQSRASADQPRLDHVDHLHSRDLRRQLRADRPPPKLRSESVVGPLHHHFGRDDRRRFDSRVHQDLHLH